MRREWSRKLKFNSCKSRLPLPDPEQDRRYFYSFLHCSIFDKGPDAPRRMFLIIFLRALDEANLFPLSLALSGSTADHGGLASLWLRGGRYPLG